MTLCAVGAVVGLALVLFAFTQQEEPAPSLEEPVGDVPSAATPSPSASADDSDEADAPLGASEPSDIRIPSLDISSDVFSIGLADDGSIAVPQPGPNLNKAAWFENSPTPGQPGPSIIEGHVSTAEEGPSIFYRLAELSEGDTVEVDRADGTTAVFEVTALREFAKDSFPTRVVYGGDLSTPQLRLITCSNLDPATGTHQGNLVVFTELVDVQGA